MAKNQGPWGSSDDVNPWGSAEETVSKPKVVNFEKIIDRKGGNGGFEFKIKWAVLILLLVWLASGFYQVQPSEQGSCGAELICDASTAATSCPYCGNPTVVPGQFSGALKPDFVLPFKLSKEDAVAALKNHYKGKPLLPKAFTSGNHIEKIQGVYVPFWMFDGQAEGTVDYEGLIHHEYETSDYEVTETEHYDVHRGGSISFEKVPVDASSKMPDDHMDSIEPYDYTDLKSFSTAYLPGFLADKYDVSVEDSHDRADGRCAASLESALRRTAEQYDSCIPLRQDIRLRRGKVHYALLPVWMLHTKWKGQDFLFAMNGQTGRLVGDLPTDMGKFWTIFAAVAAPVAAITAAIMMLV